MHAALVMNGDGRGSDGRDHAARRRAVEAARRSVADDEKPIVCLTIGSPEQSHPGPRRYFDMLPGRRVPNAAELVGNVPVDHPPILAASGARLAAWIGFRCRGMAAQVPEQQGAAVPETGRRRRRQSGADVAVSG